MLQRALAKHGSDRFGSCEEFIKELKEGAPALFDVSSISVVENESSGVATKTVAADVAFRPTAERSYVHTSSDSSRIWIIAGCVSALFLLGIIAWGVMGSGDKTPPAEVVVQVAPQPVIVEQVAPPAPPQPAYQSPFRDIFEAAEKGLVRDVEFFIKNGVNVNARSNPGWSPLHMAARHNPNVEVLKYLILQGADANMRTNFGHTSLHLAVQNTNLEISQYLISRGADLNARTSAGHTVLHFAIQNPNLEIARYLVSRGADVNEKNGMGFTPLHEAAWHNPNVEALRYLVSLGAEVNTSNDWGGTPLTYAAFFRFIRQLRTLFYV